MNPGPLAVRKIDPVPLREVSCGKRGDRIKLAVAASMSSLGQEREEIFGRRKEIRKVMMQITERELSRMASYLNFTCKIDFLVWFGSLIIMRIGPDYLYHKMKCDSTGK